MTDDGFAWLEQDHRDIEEQFQTFLRDNEEPVVRAVCEHPTQHSDAVSAHVEFEELELFPAMRESGVDAARLFGDLGEAHAGESSS